MTRLIWKTTTPYHSHVFYIKYWNTWWLPICLDILRTRISSLTYSMVSNKRRSCETQLIMLIDELSKNMQSRKQTDLILLDFSKSFDKVAHEKLLQKLHSYGIRGCTLKWIKDVLDNIK